MEAEYGAELLGIEGRDRIYAVELSNVEEICFDIKTSKIPCLPSHFKGMFNYRGDILPVAQLEERDDPARTVLLVVRCGEYRLGVLIPGEPYVITVDQARQIDKPLEAEASGIWKTKAILQTEKGLTFLLDMERSVEHMVVFK